MHKLFLDSSLTNLGVDLLASSAAFGVGKGIDCTSGTSNLGSTVLWQGGKDSATKSLCELTLSGLSKELVSNVFGGIGEIASDSFASNSVSNSSNKSVNVLDNSFSDFKIDNSLNIDFSQNFNFNSNIDIDLNINFDLNISIDLKGLCMNYLNTVK